MTTLQVRLHAISYEAPTINTYELRTLDGAALPSFSAGAHIDVHLPNGMTRSYSLCNAPHETHRYLLGVNRDPASRGGSQCVHEDLQVGTTLEISAPRNHFPLVEDAPHTVLVAGGIGITPMLSMLQRLEALGRSWELHYCSRTRAVTGFIAALAQYGARVQWHHDAEADGVRLDLAALLQSHDTSTHFYCCGPSGMLSGFEAAAAQCAGAPERFHVEYFAAKEASAAEGGFTVQLARSGRLIPVRQGKTILDALVDAGVEVSYSCSQGVCGTCETRVLEGVPDHRDMVLTKGEQQTNRSMMICCSGSKSACLVLDL
ncbi:PDR/VanB family oxidoreductase [Paraburkholderia bonniea]|uniref:PDR/VanB family oxidoreductase n=1 Tax=Paraburkholderia bonniea TaxID=2152891 RepID=UPI0012925C27|nr:PDR/VanB family oxidoreductase [Paraburkholderia bonniea]WJF91917.1 PDR/VanB family oxidoreductase [Paraburkholderia bonniea]WJF95236.1 PDR/VanB family oxidoreductase [Paraburkholderia bonniea]